MQTSLPAVIRPFMLADYPQVVALWNASPGVGLDESDSADGTALFLNRNPGLSQVAVVGERVVGAVLCGHDGRRGYLAHLAVADDWRERGIGRRMVQECLDRLAAAGIVKCNLRMYADNGAGRRFWERLGWTLRDDVLVMTTHTPRAANRSDPRGSSGGSGTWPRGSAGAAAGASLPLFQVDAFSDAAFAGNPAAVCLLRDSGSAETASAAGEAGKSAEAESRWMRQVAAEMNLSETAFVRRLTGTSEPPLYELRWFTPRVEVDLCGHATLAAAHVLREQGLTGRDEPIGFQTRGGPLRAVPDGEDWEMDFPATPQQPATAPAELLEALGVAARYVGRGPFDYLVEVATAEVVRGLAPDLGRLARVDTRGVIVTAGADGEPHDFVSRFFAPACGVDEDPVTGSAHCCLGPFWAERLGRTSLVGFQASPRGGQVRMRLSGDRVWLGGRAVTIFCGWLRG